MGWRKKYAVYLLTNKHKMVFYIGVTNNLKRRLAEHKEASLGNKKSFAGRYNCIYLVYYEMFDRIMDAISREKELKGWKRIRKIDLVNTMNPKWRFLNDEIED